MKKLSLKNKLVAELERTPIIQVACDKVGISRNTFYRWRNDDPYFAQDVKEALGLGIELVNDVAESNVLNGIKNKDLRHTQFWLRHRHPSYKHSYFNRHEKEPFDQAEYERKMEQAIEDLTTFQDRWFVKDSIPKYKKEKPKTN